MSNVLVRFAAAAALGFAGNTDPGRRDRYGRRAMSAYSSEERDLVAPPGRTAANNRNGRN